MLHLYRLLSLIFSPFVLLWLRHRIRQGKEDAERFRERLGVAGLPRPHGKLVWIHAASVGEANSAMPLLRYLHTHYADLYFVLTTGTVSSARVIGSRLPERAFHHYVPADLPWAVGRFLRHWQPDLAIWVESELWPNLIYGTYKRGIPMALINARISDRSYRRWRHFRGFFMKLAQCFQVIYAGSAEDRRRLLQLGVHEVRLAGNLKYDASPLTADPKITAQVLAKVGDRPLWLAASTHEGEEQLIAEVHTALQETFPDLLTIIAPRHPYRGEQIVQELTGHKLTVSCRSRAQMILPETDIYIADTLGELGIFYRISGIVFVGGSLVPHGGHNPIEPSQLDCAVICGPYMHNFLGIIRELLDEQALLQVQNTAELTSAVGDLLRDQDKQEQHARAAQKSVESRQGAVDLMITDLAPLLNLPLVSAREG